MSWLPTANTLGFLAKLQNKLTTRIKAEATPNSEMLLIVDVDLDALKELHTHGSVNTMKDRRHDVYQLSLVNPLEK